MRVQAGQCEMQPKPYTLDTHVVHGDQPPFSKSTVAFDLIHNQAETRGKNHAAVFAQVTVLSTV
jgi:hypothetical protein